jgi:Pyridine nucleotide-disulphide oxidoreductase
VAVVGPGALAAEVALFLAGWGRRPTVVVPGLAEDPFPDVHPMHAARLRERLEGYKVPLVTGATPVAWRYDPGRRSVLVASRGGMEGALGPFHTAISAAGWAAPPGQAPRVPGVPDGETRWPQAIFGRVVPDEVPDGAVVRVGDTLYPEPLRDLVQYAHQLGRVL